MKIKTVPISELQTDDNNARLHSARNIEVIAKSLEMFGQRKPIVVHNGKILAGNGTLEAAKTLGWTEITITEVPDNWDSDTAKAYAIADNRTAELADWNEDTLIKQLLELENDGWEIKDFGFDDLLPKDSDDDGEKDNPYSMNVVVPQYEIVGEKPAINELFDKTKTERLQENIIKANLPSEITDFLLSAATRHTVFNYKKIAEYYPHVSPDIQELIEESALVIIDFEDAIANGYAKLKSLIDDLKDEDNDEEE